MTERQIRLAIIWVSLVVVITAIGLIAALFSDQSPSYCGDCPPHWQQQPW